MIHLAWMLLLLAATPDILADALPDCILQVPVTVTVAAKNEIEHEDCHAFHATLRQTYGKPTVYVGAGKAAVVDEPSIHLSSVAADVPASQRGPVYKLYLVDAQRWWNAQPSYILDESWCYLNGTAWYTAKGRTSDAVYSAARARELSRYASVLLRLARRLPGYDSRQLEAIVEYQWKRVGSLPASSAAVAAAPPKSAPPVATPDSSSLPGTTERAREASAMPRHTAADVWNKTVVVAWEARWCPSCPSMHPLYERIRNRPGVTLLLLDVDKPMPTFVKSKPSQLPTVFVYRSRQLQGQWFDASEATKRAIEEEVSK